MNFNISVFAYKYMELTPKEKIRGLILPKKITPNLAYFCGVLAGDGSISYRKKKSEYEIKCVGNPRNEREYYDFIIKDLVKELFNLEIFPREYDKGVTYGFRIWSKNMVKYLTEFIGLPLGKKYEHLAIPRIFLQNKSLVRNFISGVADTDFHLAIKKRNNYPVIMGCSKSKIFMEEIKSFLEEEGFKVCIYQRNDFDKRVNKAVITHRIELSGRRQLRRWLQYIGFRHPKYNSKINIFQEGFD